mmetsp:Transcript_2862/g.3267  ORF Transcript_2862/g.3267 Transcript_2862/m.3267 type:complete len:120 (+) Transcript_2862:133-492(+)
MFGLCRRAASTGHVYAGVKSNVSHSRIASSTLTYNKFLSTDASNTEKEVEITKLLQDSLDNATVRVTDISGGCGSMYDIEVVSSSFEGKNRVQQQRMVNEILKKEISEMHGLKLTTKKP